jgi:DNA-binding CsgD family transcriptional regulator
LGQLTQRDILALATCVAEIFTLRDLEDFRDHVLRAVAKVVPVDVITYTELGLRGQPSVRVVHPAAIVATELMKIFDHYRHEHPLIQHFAEHPQARVAKISDFLTTREFHRLGLYSEFFRKIGVEHQMVIGLPAPSPRMAGVALSRSRSDFSERDRMVLSVLQPHIVQASRNAVSFARVKHEAAMALTGLEEMGQGMVLLGPDGEVRLVTKLARRWLAAYFPHSLLRAKRLPDELQRWVKFQDKSIAVPGDIPTARAPLLVDGKEARLVVRLIPAADGQILVLQQQRTVITPASLKALGLSRRETEVLAWVSQGKTDASIAAILSLSPRTVAKHLEHIYERLGVENRLAAAALAFAASAVPS